MPRFSCVLGFSISNGLIQAGKEVAKNRADLEEIIRIKSRAIGPWPKNMSVLVYPLGDTWGAMIGFSDVSQTEFRDKALALCRELRETYDLIE